MGDLIEGLGGALALYGTGLVTGLVLARHKAPVRAPSASETPEESLVRLSARGRVPVSGSGALRAR